MFHNLEVEMAKARVTQYKLAEMIGITPTTLSMKLNGKSGLSLKECVVIKKVLNSTESIDYLFATEDEPKKAG